MDATTNQLPVAARQKLTAIRRELEDVQTLHRASTSRAEQLEKIIPQADPAEQVGLRDELAEERQLQAERAERRNRVASVVKNLMAFLNTCEGLAPYSGTIDVGDWSIDTIRDRIGSLQREAREIVKQPPTVHDVKQRARARLDAMGGPSLAPDGKVTFPRSRPGDTLAPDRDSTLLAMAYAVNPDATLDLIDRLAKQTYPSDGLTEMDRRIKLRDLEDQALMLERIEEVLVEQACAEGRDVLRRASASPLAILGLVRAARRKRAAA